MVFYCLFKEHLAGPQLIEKARQIAEARGKPNFKGSNGWLTKWKARHNIKRVRICGESGDVHGETVQSLKERLPEVVRGYDKDNIWNMDETGVFWQALPETGFGQKEEGMQGREAENYGCIFVTADGAKEKPIVIWHSENP